MKTLYTNTCKTKDFKPIYKVDDKYYVCFLRSSIKRELSRTLKNGRFIKTDAVEDTDYCTYRYFVFDTKPSPNEIKTAFEEYVNDSITKRITNGFEYNGKKVNLSKENQMNYKAAYDLAVQTGGMNLPYKIKTTYNGNREYLVFNNVNELTDFYVKLNNYIQNCLEDGWHMKDAIDYNIYVA